MATSIQHLPKTDKRISRRPDMTKYYLSSCKERITRATPTTEGWLSIMRTLKLSLNDYDKSRIFLGHLKERGEIVVKLGDSSDIQKEYEFSRKLQTTKGFVKYICVFECEDDFRKIRNTTSHICRGPGSSMKVLLMPYFPLGSLASYRWTDENLLLFQTCLKHSVLSVLSAYANHSIIHGDFHAGNVLLKPTKSSSLTYSFQTLTITVPTHGIRTWIMDFENTSIADTRTQYGMIMAMNNLYFDLKKFFSLLHLTIPLLDIRSLVPIEQLFNKRMCESVFLSPTDIQTLLQLIDGINHLPPIE